MILRKSFYIRWSAGRSPRVHEVNPGRDPSTFTSHPRTKCLLLVMESFLKESSFPKESVGVRHLLKKFKNHKLPHSLPWKFYMTHNQLLSEHLLYKAHEGPIGFIMSPRDMDFS